MKKTDEIQERTDDVLYKTGLALIIVSLLFFGAAKIFSINEIIFQWRCIINYLTGYYCPGCGGTRAFVYLIHGDIPNSVRMHPVILYGAVIFTAYMGTNTVKKLSGGKIPIGMRYKDYYIWIGFAILIVNFIYRNIMIFLTGSPG